MRCSLEASALPVDLILECSAEPSVLAGYVVECAFKLLVEQYFANNDAARKFGHNLQELEGKARERLGILYPRLEQQLPVSRIRGTVLGQNRSIPGQYRRLNDWHG